MRDFMFMHQGMSCKNSLPPSFILILPFSFLFTLQVLVLLCFFKGVHCVTMSVLTSSPLQEMARVSGAATKVQIL